MRIFKMCSCSAAVLLAAVSLAQAQSGEKERQSSEPAPKTESVPQGKPKAETAPHQSEQHGQKSAQTNPNEREKAGEGREGQPRSNANDGKNNHKEGQERAKDNEHGKNERAEHDKPRDGKTPDAGKPNDRAAQGSGKAGEHDRPTVGNRTNAEGNERGGESKKRVNVTIRPEQKTRVHDIVVKNTAVRHYRRSDIHFTVNVGVRIPEDVVYYDAPSELVELVPDVRSYKVIFLDDEILIVDPYTREIIEVIEI